MIRNNRLCILLVLLLPFALVAEEDEGKNRTYKSIYSIDLGNVAYSVTIKTSPLIPGELLLLNSPSNGIVLGRVGNRINVDTFFSISYDADFLITSFFGVFAEMNTIIAIGRHKGDDRSIQSSESRFTFGPSFYFVNDGIKGLFLRGGVSGTLGTLSGVGAITGVTSGAQMALGCSIYFGYNFVFGKGEYGVSLTPVLALHYDYNDGKHFARVPFGLKVGLTH